MYCNTMPTFFAAGRGEVSLTRATNHEFRTSSFLMSDAESRSVGDVLIYSSLTTDSEKVTDLSAAISQGDHPLFTVLRDWNITVLAAEIIPKGSGLHAEQHCTGRVYDYILPVGYLRGTGNEQQWTLDEFDRRFRDCLKAFSLPKLAEKGGFRFRKSEEQAALREGRRWHNYYHANEGTLANTKGFSSLASTHNAAMRSVDRFFAVGGLYNKFGWKTHRVSTIDGKGPCEEEEEEFETFRVVGDGFLTGQVRGMVGVVICVMRGWLPMDFIAFSQRADVVIETPLAPPGLLFLSEARYDWHLNQFKILNHKSFSGFNSSVYKYVDEHGIDVDPTPSAAAECDGSFYYNRAAVDRTSLEVIRAIVASTAASQATMQEWMHDMKEVVCPRIVSQMESIRLSWDLSRLLTAEGEGRVVSGQRIEDPFSALHQCPPVYKKVLRLLIEADRSVTTE